jgi:crotonobetainyl-CoA:carnitine CoA-transferase CaiB-like acyl-CoA transferase
MSVTGEKDQPPLKSGMAVSDIFTGLFMVQGILA